MSLRPFFCFYGGKWRSAPLYQTPTCLTIVEPFAGAAGYATRYYSRPVILVERDPVIAALWRWLISVKASDVRSVPILGMDQTTDDLRGVGEEARTLVGFWLNKGASAPRRSPSAWMRQGIRPKSFWCETVRSRIADQVEHIRHWRIIEGSYEQAPDVLATWYVDPPYVIAGKHYRYHDIDYPRLAAWAKERRGQVIVCENAGAEWLPFEPFADVKSNESSSGGKVSREVVCQWFAA